jgi:hypothetical protein
MDTLYVRQLEAIRSGAQRTRAKLQALALPPPGGSPTTQTAAAFKGGASLTELALKRPLLSFEEALARVRRGEA